MPAHVAQRLLYLRLIKAGARCACRQHAEMLKQRNELNNQRKELWRQDSESKE